MDQTQLTPILPSIVLVEPQSANNIGSVARAMLNFGLKDLRIVNPLEGWPQKTAYTMASGANSVLDDTLIFNTLEEALGDFDQALAVSARKHDIIKQVYFPKTAPEHEDHYLKTALVFGREKNGLEGFEVALCDGIITIPNNPDFSSLNLSQAVLLVAYEWFQYVHRDNLEQKVIWMGGYDSEKRAKKEEVFGFLTHLEEVLDTVGYFKTEEKRPIMWRTLKNMFTRENFSSQEIRSLRGILRSVLFKIDEKTSA